MDGLYVYRFGSLGDSSTASENSDRGGTLGRYYIQQGRRDIFFPLHSDSFHFIIIIIIKRGRQSKAEREWSTPSQSKDLSPTIYSLLSFHLHPLFLYFILFLRFPYANLWENTLAWVRISYILTEWYLLSSPTETGDTICKPSAVKLNSEQRQ